MDRYQVKIYKNNVLDQEPINMFSGDECFITVGSDGIDVRDKYVFLKWRIKKLRADNAKLKGILIQERETRRSNSDSYGHPLG